MSLLAEVEMWHQTMIPREFVVFGHQKVNHFVVVGVEQTFLQLDLEHQTNHLLPVVVVAVGRKDCLAEYHQTKILFVVGVGLRRKEIQYFELVDQREILVVGLVDRTMNLAEWVEECRTMRIAEVVEVFECRRDHLFVGFVQKVIQFVVVAARRMLEMLHQTMILSAVEVAVRQKAILQFGQFVLQKETLAVAEAVLLQTAIHQVWILQTLTRELG
jgi:hypothetical protein